MSEQLLVQATGAGGPDASTILPVDRTRLAYERTMLSWIRTAIAHYIRL